MFRFEERAAQDFILPQTILARHDLGEHREATRELGSFGSKALGCSPGV